MNGSDALCWESICILERRPFRADTLFDSLDAGKSHTTEIITGEAEKASGLPKRRTLCYTHSKTGKMLQKEEVAEGRPL